MLFEDGMKQEKQQHESRRITGAEMQQCPAQTDYHCLGHEQYEDALRGRGRGEEDGRLHFQRNGDGATCWRTLSTNKQANAKSMRSCVVSWVVSRSNGYLPGSPAVRRKCRPDSCPLEPGMKQECCTA